MDENERTELGMIKVEVQNLKRSISHLHKRIDSLVDKVDTINGWVNQQKGAAKIGILFLTVMVAIVASAVSALVARITGVHG